MPLTLTKRVPNGAPLSAAQHDANMTAIEGLVNTTETDLNTAEANITTIQGQITTINNTLSGLSGTVGKAAFRAEGGVGTQTVAIDGTDKKITHLVGESYDPDNVYNGGTQRFTAPLKGVYQFTVRLQADNSGGTASGMVVTVGLKKNNTSVVAGATNNHPSPANSRWFVHFTESVELLANDYIEVIVNAADGVNVGSLTISNDVFCGHFVRAT